MTKKIKLQIKKIANKYKWTHKKGRNVKKRGVKAERERERERSSSKLFGNQKGTRKKEEYIEKGRERKTRNKARKYNILKERETWKEIKKKEGSDKNEKDIGKKEMFIVSTFPESPFLSSSSFLTRCPLSSPPSLAATPPPSTSLETNEP